MHGAVLEVLSTSSTPPLQHSGTSPEASGKVTNQSSDCTAGGMKMSRWHRGAGAGKQRRFGEKEVAELLMFPHTRGQ